jgi:hypothetical protein
LGEGNDGSSEDESQLNVDSDKEFNVKIEGNWIQYKELNDLFAVVPTDKQAMQLTVYALANPKDKRDGVFVGEEQKNVDANVENNTAQTAAKKPVSVLTYKFKVPSYSIIKPQNELEMRIVLKRKAIEQVKIDHVYFEFKIRDYQNPEFVFSGMRKSKHLENWYIPEYKVSVFMLRNRHKQNSKVYFSVRVVPE